MPHYSESRRSFLLGMVGLALGSCASEKRIKQPSNSLLEQNILPQFENPTVIPTPLPTLTVSQEIIKPREKEYFDPQKIIIPSQNLVMDVGKGRRTEDNKDLMIPEGGHIVDYSRVIPAGDKTLVLAGHSYWRDVKCPMGLTFELQNQDLFVIEDGAKNIPTGFKVEKRLVLNWDKTLNLIYPDKKTGTTVMFTSLRTDIRQNFKQLMKYDEVVKRADNPDQVEEFYKSRDYLYWVVLSSESEIAMPPQYF